jgi:hypothetical protein
MQNFKMLDFCFEIFKDILLTDLPLLYKCCSDEFMK